MAVKVVVLHNCHALMVAVRASELELAQHFFKEFMDASWLLSQLVVATLMGAFHVLRLSTVEANQILALITLDWVDHKLVALLAHQIFIDIRSLS